MTHYAKRRSEGRCISCPALNPQPQHARCLACRERYKQRHEAALAARKCPDCGTEHDTDKSRCPSCLQKKTLLYAQRRTAGLCPHCGSDKPIAPGRHCQRCQTINTAKDRRKNRKLRQQVLEAYGGKCQCCGETTPEFLHVDHVHNDGAKHRRQLFGNNKHGNGVGLYTWLRKHGFPKEGFQLLCANCNFAKGHYGECPHQREKLKLKEYREDDSDNIEDYDTEPWEAVSDDEHAEEILREIDNHPDV